MDEANLSEELAGLNRLRSWNPTLSDQQLRQLGINPLDYDFPIVMNDQVQYYLDLFQGKQRKSFQRQLERSSIYMADIKKELKMAGLPQDLAYLAMIESGYNPTVCSSAKACGMWQFIESTGRNYNLTIDDWVDERREPEKATRAAIRYLGKLYGDFNDWHLAVAAYNAGEYRIAKAIETYNTKNFWEIAESDGIYLETKRYVPKLIAAIIIARNPAKYGFTELNYMQPSRHELVHVPGGTDLRAVSVCSGTSVQDLRTLNTELRKDKTPPSTKHYALRVPSGKKDMVAGNLHRVHPISNTAYLNHTVARGETVNTVCKRYGISKKSLLSTNKLRSSSLKQGMRLRIPSQTTKYVLLQEGERPEDFIARQTGARNENRKIMYSVRSGDTLYQIARNHKVSVQDLKKWNAFPEQVTLRVGQRITVGQAAAPSTSEPSLSRARIAVVPNAISPLSSEDPVVKLERSQYQSISEPRSTSVRLAISEPLPVQENNKITTQASVSSKPAETTIASTGRAKKTAAIAHARGLASSLESSGGDKHAFSWYVVQSGDSLWGIARKFQTTPQNLRQWNQLSSNNLQTGNKIIVKKI